MLFKKIDFYLSKLAKPYEALNLIEINEKNILYNYDFFKKLNGNNEVWPVLKSNAYGHGIKQISKILLKRDFEYFVVDGYQEVLEIRQITKRPVLMIGTINPINFSNINWHNLAIMVQDRESIKSLGKGGKKVTIHLKINTGMNRQGIKLEEVKEIVKLIKKYPKLKLEGIFSHLANADSIDDRETLKQLEKFKEAIRIVEEMGIKLKYCHLAATAGVTKIKDPKINAIRLGIGLYLGLKPSLSFKTVFTKILEIEKGDKVGYGGTFVADKKTKVGVIPVGYFEALDRRLSNKGFVKYKNKFYPIIGRICMNLVMINLGKTEAKIFNEVELISNNPKDKNSIEKMADICHTIPYEILVKINSSIRRIIK